MSIVKLKAGALQYTIFISVLIALLVTSLIGLSYLHQKTRIKANFFQETIAVTNSTFAYLANNEMPFQKEVELILPEAFKGTSLASKKHWGIFDLVSTQVHIKNEVFNKMALMGGQRNNRPALYVNDNNKPLVVVGETKIRGNVFLPEKGVRRGNISGHSYRGIQLVYGKKLVSNKRLPELENKNYLKQLTQGIFSKAQMIRFELHENKKFENSFENNTQIFESSDAIDLRFITLSGNFIIQSHNSITVSKSSRLEDVILIAPKISIESGVEGNFQAFASEIITVGSGCNLKYPTALVVHEKSKVSSNQKSNPQLQQEAKITIGSGTIIKGTVVFLSSNVENSYQSQMYLEENAVVVGELYSEKNIELRGKIKGMVYADSFIAKQFGSVYINHIYNGTISEPELPEQYAGLSFLDDAKKVVKWVY